ncbi:MAG TPA: GntG family PLP-dependent aldolase [Actinomycetota bacterium]|jgi:threonine aldolase|nr:GntG family PLP-dependent aldolase [Actinomycetota bacterium]
MSSDGFIDLRSDTVTLPTEAMRRAMAAADLGDDCYGEDPTVNGLQELAADLLGCEAAIYVPTGTMANQIALKVLSSPGGEVICEQDCHLVHFESGASAVLSQVQLRGLRGAAGVLDPSDVEQALRPSDPFQPQTSMVAVENTHNGAGGTTWSLDAFASVSAVARTAGVPLFCDGARLFNACVATQTKASDYSALCELITVSLYKGLAAPMGSLLCGSRELIERAWLFRRIFGGALRQAGVVAAAGVVALQTMIDRLGADHEHARRLGEGLAASAPPGTVPLDRVQTNMVIFDAAAAGIDHSVLLGLLKEQGILAGLNLPGPVVRFVTHKDIAASDVDRAISAFASSLKTLR